MIELDIRGRAGVGKTTLLAHLAHCLRKAGYEVEVDADIDPGELECLPPYFKKGQKIVLTETDTSVQLPTRRSWIPHIVAVICLLVILVVIVLPLEIAVKVLIAFVVALMVAALFSGMRA